MRQAMNIRQTPTLTVDEHRERLARLEGQIATNETELERLQDALPGLIAAHLGSDLAAVKERAAIRDLKEFVADLHRTHSILHAQMEQAEQADRDEALRAAYREAQAAGEQLSAEVRELQKDIERTVASIAKVRKADEKFCRTLRGDPSGFDRRSFSVLLPRHIEIAQYSLSDGEVSARGIIDSPYQVRQAGRHDLTNTVNEYIAVGLRGADLPS